MTRITGHGSHDPSYTTLLGLHVRGLGSVRFARRYSGHRRFFLFLGVLRCFNSPRSRPPTMHSSTDGAALTRTAFPHSEIPGSKVVCTSPRLIAADHVLHRLSAPRHPPHTLNSLTTEVSVESSWVKSRILQDILGGGLARRTIRDNQLLGSLFGTLFTCQRSWPGTIPGTTAPRALQP